MNWLIDTGFLLRFFNRTDPQHGESRQAVRSLHRQGAQLSISPQNVAEFWCVCTRPSSARGGYGLTVAEVARRVRTMERMFLLLPDSPDAFARLKEFATTRSVMGVQVHDTLGHGRTGPRREVGRFDGRQWGYTPADAQHGRLQALH